MADVEASDAAAAASAEEEATPIEATEEVEAKTDQGEENPAEGEEPGPGGSETQDGVAGEGQAQEGEAEGEGDKVGELDTAAEGAEVEEEAGGGDVSDEAGPEAESTEGVKEPEGEGKEEEEGKGEEEAGVATAEGEEEVAEGAGEEVEEGDEAETNAEGEEETEKGETEGEADKAEEAAGEEAEEADKEEQSSAETEKDEGEGASESPVSSAEKDSKEEAEGETAEANEGEEEGQEKNEDEDVVGAGEEGEENNEEDEEGAAELTPISPGINEREVIKNLLAEAYEEENELKEVSNELEQKILLLEKFRTRRGSVIGLTSSIVHDIEARYLSSLLSWSDYMQEEARIAQHYQTVLMDLRMKLEEKDRKAMKLEEEYAIFKEELIKMAEYSRTGKSIPNHVVNEINLLEDEKEIEKSKVRSRNIHLQHQLKDLEGRLKQKEELAEGLHLIDFEQLKIENQSLNEKIEERNEELLKLRKKTTTTVQILTHLKEKLQFVQKKNNILDSELGNLDMQLSSKRDKLQKEKQSREKARDDTMKLREKSGLITDPVLLQDVEKQKQKREFLANKVEEIQQKFLKINAEMTMSSQQL